LHIYSPDFYVEVFTSPYRFPFLYTISMIQHTETDSCKGGEVGPFFNYEGSEAVTTYSPLLL